MTAAHNATPSETPANPPLRVLLIDDHALFRQGLKAVLQSNATPAQVWEAASVREALSSYRPGTVMDVILLDVQLQGERGVDGIGALRLHFSAPPHESPRLVVISALDTSQDHANALRKGADAFLSKSASAEVLSRVITQRSDSAAADESIEMAALAASQIPGDALACSVVTPRQLEVLALLAQGKSNKVIGKDLGLSENTVRAHLVSVFAHLGVNSRTAAVTQARLRGLLA
jgi:two-component system, NarL family, nitrate/nitrite response regulator NarL